MHFNTGKLSLLLFVCSAAGAQMKASLRPPPILIPKLDDTMDEGLIPDDIDATIGNVPNTGTKEQPVFNVTINGPEIDTNLKVNVKIVPENGTNTANISESDVNTTAGTAGNTSTVNTTTFNTVPITGNTAPNNVVNNTAGTGNTSTVNTGAVTGNINAVNTVPNTGNTVPLASENTSNTVPLVNNNAVNTAAVTNAGNTGNIVPPGSETTTNTVKKVADTIKKASVALAKLEIPELDTAAITKNFNKCVKSKSNGTAAKFTKCLVAAGIDAPIAEKMSKGDISKELSMDEVSLRIMSDEELKTGKENIKKLAISQFDSISAKIDKKKVKKIKDLKEEDVKDVMDGKVLKKIKSKAGDKEFTAEEFGKAVQEVYTDTFRPPPRTWGNHFNEYKWYYLIAIVVLLAGGAFYYKKRESIEPEEDIDV